MMDEENVERLREALIEDFGTAMVNGNPEATIYLASAENGDLETLKELAQFLDYNLSDYGLE